MNSKRQKLQVLTLIFISVVINYMDRTNLSIAAAQMKSELSISTVEMGLLFSAFAWTYSFLQIPGGILADRIKVRVLYPIIMIGWSVATLVQGLISNFAALIGLRMLVGAFEAPSYPLNNKIVSQWFQEQERAGAIAVYTSGQFIGLAFAIPLLAIVLEWVGWRGLFITSGAVGIAWGLVWYFIYPRRLSLGKTMSKQGNTPPSSADLKTTKQQLKVAFTNRKLWGLYLGQFCLGSTLVFFLTWFPTYLSDYRGLSIIKSGFYAAIPFLCAFCGVLISGTVSDKLTRNGVRPELSRKAPVIIGLLLSSSVIGANYVESPIWVTVFLSLSFFGNGLASINWVFVSLIAPKSMVGLVGGCFNFIGGLSAVIIPITIGFLVADGDFKPALVLIFSLALVGSLSFIFLVGKIEQIPEPSTPSMSSNNSLL
ncbi:MFS transporter [Alteromonas sp. KUL17]|uniref:MFS transporter n=1 Tax=Alteromonas sp. KUL17 TaxID=2480796 RepID=UPI0010376C91|nr:MFS transporter [Alteromonas sp. KUL17]TAP30594.1 MFS transporter [Alteromonas sp. KUL17]GEA01585.1 MFS transporter [Alteromonas sp. KUL17]